MNSLADSFLGELEDDKKAYATHGSQFPLFYRLW